MRIGALLRIACLGSIALLAGASGAAQTQVPPNMSGIINDYSAGAGGPWHLSAEWDLRIKGASGRADFSAAVAMVRSDLWVVLNQADPADTEARMPHTHHVTVSDAAVTSLSNGIRITGTASVTGSGNPAFEAPIQIDVTGGSAVSFSNIAVTFGAPASNHFGTLPLNGVVSRF
ncbi:MAG TPA: hypothetical protein VGD94_22295 [Vicinamibacterales bacterium]